MSWLTYRCWKLTPEFGRCPRCQARVRVLLTNEGRARTFEPDAERLHQELDGLLKFDVYSGRDLHATRCRVHQKAG